VAPSDESTDTASQVSPPEVGGTKCPYLLVIAGTRVGELHKLTLERTVIGRGSTAQIQITDDGISREHVAFTTDGGRVTLRDLASTNGTYCNGLRVSTREVVDGDKVSIGSTTILKFTYQDGMDEAFHQELYESALRDPLTSALKKEHFLERMNEEVAYACRHGSPLAMIFADLDKFKAINDTHGHPAGDQVLSMMTKVVRSLLRREDLFARYGGEEFAVACRSTDLETARALADRLRKAIEETSLQVGTTSLRVTASFGVAVCPSEGIADVQALVAAADQAMYRAKTRGRNRVEV
jgi:two-component system cell cycle response regulator